MLHTLSFRALGGPCTLQLGGVGQAAASQAFDQARQELGRIERAYSRYRSDSIVSRLNAAAGGDWIECDAETQRLLDLAAALHARSGGLFDATSGVLRRAWRFGQPDAAVPTEAELAPLLALVGWADVQRQGAAVRLARAGMELDFGGIGKEYAVDRVAQLWLESGLPHGLVNLAGDIRVFGGHPEGRPWRLGIQHPRRPGAILAEIALHEGALATSGDYERALVDAQGRRHGHILHPRTGRPDPHWQSVSVVAPLAVIAGGQSTVSMLMGAQALPWLEQQGAHALAVDAQGRIHQSAKPLASS